MTKSRPVLLGNAIFSGLTIITGSIAVFGELGVSKSVLGLIVLLIAAAQVTFNTYVQGLVIPQSDVAAYIDNTGKAVAGPAAGQTNGTPVKISDDPNPR